MEGTGNTALGRFSVEKPQRIEKRGITFRCVTNTSHVQNDIEKHLNAEVVGTINLCPPSFLSTGLELGAKFSKFLEDHDESTTVFIDYHLWGELPLVRVPLNVKLRSELRAQVSQRKYGHYYVAGVEKKYDMRVLAAYK